MDPKRRISWFLLLKPSVLVPLIVFSYLFVAELSLRWGLALHQSGPHF
jgi:hypothetical protein